MHFIVLDLEWNQSPTGKTEENPSIPFEIIEIGAVKISESQQIIDEFHRIICPQVYMHLDENVKNIVHLTEEDLKKGVPFCDAIKNFLQWCGEDAVFCTWGPMDLVELQRNMKHYGIPALARNPFFYYDVQSLYSIFFDEEKKTRTLSFASEFFHLTEEGDFHSAITDARYTAKIFQKFDLKKTKKFMEIDYFTPPKTPGDEIYVTFKNYSKYISMEYKTKEQLLHAKRLRTIPCCVCQKPTSKVIDWFTNNSKNYYGVFQCKMHGYLKGKLRVKKTDNNHCFAVRTLKIISKEEATRLKTQKDEIHNKKKKT